MKINSIPSCSFKGRITINEYKLDSKLNPNIKSSVTYNTSTQEDKIISLCSSGLLPQKEVSRKKIPASKAQDFIDTLSYITKLPIKSNPLMDFSYFNHCGHKIGLSNEYMSQKNMHEGQVVRLYEWNSADYM